MSDPFADYTPGLESPPTGGFAITPSDSTDLPQVTRALNVGTAGTLRVLTQDGSDVTLTVAAGILVPLRARRILQAGTTADQLVGLY